MYKELSPLLCLPPSLPTLGPRRPCAVALAMCLASTLSDNRVSSDFIQVKTEGVHFFFPKEVAFILAAAICPCQDRLLPLRV